MAYSGASRHPRRGFTLIELLIVIGIIAVLTGITLPAVMKAREASNRAACINNLYQFGIACTSYHNDFGYFPTAGGYNVVSAGKTTSYGDYAAPLYNTTVLNGVASTSTINGWQQPAGWAYQILPYLGEDNVWLGGNPTIAAGTRAQTSMQVPIKAYICPSRRSLTTWQYTNAAYPSDYPALLGTTFTVAPIDYAGCANSPSTIGTLATPYAPAGYFSTGIMQSQALGKSVVRATDVKDGLTYTLLIAEKAANPRSPVVPTYGGSITNEDDVGYTSGYGGPVTLTAGVAALNTNQNLNCVRFTYPSLLPLRDGDVSGPTLGAFGSAHPTTWNGLLGDGSVQQFSYTMNPTVFANLGYISDGNIINPNDLTP